MRPKAGSTRPARATAEYTAAWSAIPAGRPTPRFCDLDACPRPGTRRLTRAPRPPWRQPTRAAAAIVVTAALALLTAACGNPSGGHGSTTAQGNSSSSGPGGAAPAATSTNRQQAIAFSHCMRSHGVPQFPDPNSSGVLPGKVDPQQLGVTATQLGSAQTACQSLLPQGQPGEFGGKATPAQLNAALTFARCMRSHGVPKWPDPSTDSEGRAVFNLQGIPGLDTHSWAPRVGTAITRCNAELPPSWGGVPVERS